MEAKTGDGSKGLRAGNELSVVDGIASNGENIRGYLHAILLLRCSTNLDPLMNAYKAVLLLPRKAKVESWSGILYPEP